MKFYLSSYKIGNEPEKLKKMLPENKKTAFITNAMDFVTDLDRRKSSEETDIRQLQDLGLSIEPLNLTSYFHQRQKLEEKLNEYGVLWVRGGNTFVLRQAMQLSGFDEILKSYRNKQKNVLYGGYSAGICVLAPTLKGIDLIDDPGLKPYGTSVTTIWNGLGILNYSVVPHYKSDHPESELALKAVNYFIKHKILFKALHDGEVIIIE